MPSCGNTAAPALAARRSVLPGADLDLESGRPAPAARGAWPRPPRASIRQDDDELVARVAHAQVVRPQRALQRVGDLAQRAIADVVAVGVVDRLELVDVHDDQRHLALRGARRATSSRARWANIDRRFGSDVSGSVSESSCVCSKTIELWITGARLLGDPLEQPAVILGVAVRLRVEQRQAADERIVRRYSGQTIAECRPWSAGIPSRLERRRAGRR